MRLNLKKLSYLKIGEISRDFLSSFHEPCTLPIPIEEIAQSKLDLQMIPVASLRERFDIDGFLGSKLEDIFIDMNLYMNNERRTRFTIAHEIGHIVLHKNIFQKLEISSPERLFKFMKEVDDNDYRWLEYQAYSFAGQVLVPKDKLLREIESKLGRIPPKKFFPEDIFPISQELLEVFNVSGEVLSRRLQKEGIITSRNSF